MGEDGKKKASQAVADCKLAEEQNVVVSTKPFKTAIDRFNDLSEMDGQMVEDSDRTKELSAADDKEIVVQRKLHKILVRILFKRPPEDKDPALAPWIFYIRLGLTFEQASVKHDVDVTVRL